MIHPRGAQGTATGSDSYRSPLHTWTSTAKQQGPGGVQCRRHKARCMACTAEDWTHPISSPPPPVPHNGTHPISGLDSDRPALCSLATLKPMAMPHLRCTAPNPHLRRPPGLLPSRGRGHVPGPRNPLSVVWYGTIVGLLTASRASSQGGSSFICAQERRRPHTALLTTLPLSRGCW